MRFTSTIAWAALAALAMTFLPSGGAQERRGPQQTAKPVSGDWPLYRHDLAGTGYSPLAQITVQNASHLTQAWTYRFPADAQAAAAKGKGRGGGGPNSEATPIVVNDVMYLPAANRVVALDPESGKEIWEYVVPAGAPSRRGVAYWRGDRTHPPHIVFTAGRRLIALNANTGKLDPGFGKEGEADMVVPYNSVPLIYKDVIVVGANTPQGPIGTPGNARAFDARTGAKLWEFSSVAQPGQPGHDTWEGDSWKERSGINAWPFYFTLDEQRGLVYLPLASPASDFYGGDRKGANLYGNSVVAVGVATGKYKWHFQTIHHDLWDHDPPAPPALFDIVRDGTTIPALAITTKSGYMYILNRETGQPVFGVEERPVPKSDVPGELAFATQLPNKTSAHSAQQCPAGGRGYRGGHHCGTCTGLPGPDRKKWRSEQRRPIHDVGLSPGRRAREEFSRVSGRFGWSQLGRRRMGPEHQLCLCGLPGRRRVGLGGKDA
jgi:quinoprotein glucose dehydrogenase